MLFEICFLTLDWCGCCTCCVCRAFLDLELEDAAWT